MAANLIQQQREAENLTDEELLYFIQNGSPHINQIILLGVADDRARQRQAPQANQPPMPTIKDQKMQQLAGPSPFSGIGSIEQPQQYADGGIVGYANGGYVGDPDDPQVPYYGPGGIIEQYREQLAQQRRDSSLYGAWRRYLQDMHGPFSEDKPTTRAPVGNAELIDISGGRVLGLPVGRATDEYVNALNGYPEDFGGQMASMRDVSYEDPYIKALRKESRPIRTLPAEVLQAQRPMRSPAAPDLPIRRPLPPLDSADPYGFGDEFMAAQMGTSMGPFMGITAPTMEEMDVRAQYAPLAELTEQLGIQTEGEAMRDRLAEQRVGQMSARRKRSQQLQDAEMRGLPFGYAARIALGQEGPSLQEGIMSLIGRREAEREAIDQGVFEIQDLQAQRQAALERGALTSAIALESRIADATVKNIFDVAKVNADAELRTDIANLQEEMRLKIAQGNQDAQRLAAAMQALSRSAQGGSQTDYAEELRAVSGALQTFVDASPLLTDMDDKDEFVELFVRLMGSAATGMAYSHASSGAITLPE